MIRVCVRVRTAYPPPCCLGAPLRTEKLVPDCHLTGALKPQNGHTNVRGEGDRRVLGRPTRGNSRSRCDANYRQRMLLLYVVVNTAAAVAVRDEIWAHTWSMAPLVSGFLVSIRLLTAAYLFEVGFRKQSQPSLDPCVCNRRVPPVGED